MWCGMSSYLTPLNQRLYRQSVGCSESLWILIPLSWNFWLYWFLVLFIYFPNFYLLLVNRMCISKSGNLLICFTLNCTIPLSTIWTSLYCTPPKGILFMAAKLLKKILAYHPPTQDCEWNFHHCKFLKLYWKFQKVSQAQFSWNFNH